MAAIVSEVTLENGHRLPDSRTLQNIIKLSVVEDKPIMMDYWVDSLEKKVIIGVRGEGKEAKKMLIKNKEEYTSFIDKVYRINDKDYIILTENSIYVVDSKIETRRVSMETEE